MTLEAGIEAKDPKLMERAQQSDAAPARRLRPGADDLYRRHAARRSAGPDYLGGKMQEGRRQGAGPQGLKVLLGSAMVN
jgi:hypothetical protein